MLEMLNWRVTYMERTKPPQQTIPTPPLDGVTFTSNMNISVELYRDLHKQVGENWLWWERLTLDNDVLEKLISHPDTVIYTLHVKKTLAGFVELDQLKKSEPAIRYFGLMPAFIGQRLGAFMMDSLVSDAWTKNIEKITLDTCDLDHPAALEFYKRHCFSEVSTEVKKAVDPRLVGILPKTAAAHIPINRKL